MLCSVCICILPYDFFGNQTAAHPVVKGVLAASLASTSLHGLGSSTVRLLAEFSFTSSPLGRRLYVNP